MLCNKKTGLWITVVFGILVALGVFNQSHGAEKNHLQFENLPVKVLNKGAAHEHNK